MITPIAQPIRWRPASEPPEPMHAVLAAFRRAPGEPLEVTIAWRTRTGLWVSEAEPETSLDVRFWAPLPAPPEEA